MDEDDSSGVYNDLKCTDAGSITLLNSKNLNRSSSSGDIDDESHNKKLL